jgi:hypothetical protein
MVSNAAILLLPTQDPANGGIITQLSKLMRYWMTAAFLGCRRAPNGGAHRLRSVVFSAFERYMKFLAYSGTAVERHSLNSLCPLVLGIHVSVANCNCCAMRAAPTHFFRALPSERQPEP